MAQSLDKLRQQSNRAKYEILVTDAEPALTFLRVATTSDDVHLRRRRQGEAIKARDLIERVMPTLELDVEQAHTLNDLMGRLRSSISALELGSRPRRRRGI